VPTAIPRSLLDRLYQKVADDLEKLRCAVGLKAASSLNATRTNPVKLGIMV
jgi:hypothetical protein